MECYGIVSAIEPEKLICSKLFASEEEAIEEAKYIKTPTKIKIIKFNSINIS